MECVKELLVLLKAEALEVLLQVISLNVEAAGLTTCDYVRASGPCLRKLEQVVVHFDAHILERLRQVVQPSGPQESL